MAPWLCLAAHPVQERLQLSGSAFDRLLAGIALDDDRLVEKQLAALGIIPPDAFALGEGGRPAEQRAECLEASSTQ